VIARSAQDLALVYDAVQGPDSADPACRDAPPEPVTNQIEAGCSGLRIARAAGYFERNARAETVALVARAAAALGSRASIDLADVAAARAAAFIITAVEGAQLHLPNLRTRAGDFDPHIRHRLLANALIPGVWYVHAQRIRRVFHERMLDVFRDVEVILAPATPTPATRIGQATIVVDGAEVLTRPNTGLLTQPISFIGLPVVTVPVGRVDGLPVGMQIIAAPWREDLCLRVARALEREGIARCEAPAEAGGGNESVAAPGGPVAPANDPLPAG
jgi:aspartyl-tRNA(Asn)/glutamyl-tRNA(Gln) amidotransferase subunit A